MTTLKVKDLTELKDKVSFRLERLREQYEIIKINHSESMPYILHDTEARIDELESLLNIIEG